MPNRVHGLHELDRGRLAARSATGRDSNAYKPFSTSKSRVIVFASMAVVPGRQFANSGVLAKYEGLD